MHRLTTGCRTEPFFLPDLVAWPEANQAFRVRQGNSSQSFGLPQPSRHQPSFPSALCRGLGQEPGSAGAPVKSRAACAEASLEMQELELKGLGTVDARLIPSHTLGASPQPCSPYTIPRLTAWAARMYHKVRGC